MCKTQDSYPVDLRKSVRGLRHSMKEGNGKHVSQTQFAAMIGVSLNTVQRYETLVAPSGAALVALARLARAEGKTELMNTFLQAVTWEIGAREVTI